MDPSNRFRSAASNFEPTALGWMTANGIFRWVRLEHNEVANALAGTCILGSNKAS